MSLVQLSQGFPLVHLINLVRPFHLFSVVCFSYILGFRQQIVRYIVLRVLVKCKAKIRYFWTFCLTIIERWCINRIIKQDFQIVLIFASYITSILKPLISFSVQYYLLLLDFSTSTTWPINNLSNNVLINPLFNPSSVLFNFLFIFSCKSIF